MPKLHFSNTEGNSLDKFLNFINLYTSKFMTKMVLRVFVYNVKREFYSSYSSTPIAAVDVQTQEHYDTNLRKEFL